MGGGASPALVLYAIAYASPQATHGSLERSACSQQPLCQFAAVEDQFSQGLLDMLVFDDHIVAFICGEEGSFAHQFPDERAAHTLRLIEQLWQAFEMQRQPLSIEVGEPLTAGVVWQLYLNGLVDAARGGSPGRRKDFRPVGGQQGGR